MGSILSLSGYDCVWFLHYCFSWHPYTWNLFLGIVYLFFFVCLSATLPLSVCLSACLSICLSFCLSVLTLFLSSFRSVFSRIFLSASPHHSVSFLTVSQTPSLSLIPSLCPQSFLCSLSLFYFTYCIITMEVDPGFLLKASLVSSSALSW